MADCDHPGCDGDDNLPNQCNFCSGRFCADHRLPEKHYCIPEKPTQESSPDFRKADAEGQDDDTLTSVSTEHDYPPTRSPNSPSSTEAPTSRSPPVQTKTESEPEANGGPPAATQVRNGLAQMWSQAAFRMRRLRYYCWRTVGIAWTLTKYAALLALVAAIATVTLSTFAPAALNALPGGGSPVGTVDVGDVGSGVGTNSTATPMASETGAATTESTKRERIEAEVHTKINNRREKYDLESVEKDDTLRQIARSHSRDMAERGYFAHESPDGDTFEDRYREAGYECRVNTGSGRYLTGGENIWMMETRSDSPAAEEIAKRAVQDWMASSGHRRNVLTEEWNNMGIGVYIYETVNIEAIYITQNFC